MTTIHAEILTVVRQDLATVHMGARKNGESLVHIVNGVALSAKMQGSRVYFYADGVRTARADLEARMCEAEYNARRSRVAHIKAINTDTAVLTEGFHARGYVGPMADVPVIVVDRDLPAGTYNAMLKARDAEPGKFDVLVVDSLSDYQGRDIDAVAKAFGMVGRTLAVAVGMMACKSPMRSYQRDAVTAAMFKAQEIKPKRNNGPRNRWGRLV